jgi:hypothetical protein
MHEPSKAVAFSATVLMLSFATPGIPANKINPSATTGDGTAVLWRNPVDIASRNLYYGSGGKADEPRGTFTFEKEDMRGSNPKFDVVDEHGVKWRVKLGDEARPETVASRLLWAVGYFANEDYFVPVLHVKNMRRLRRGSNLVSADGTVHNVRLKRHLKGEKKIGIWSWANDPFTGTREWYGLRVMMAVINNWDLKDANNSVYQVGGGSPEQLYMVSDLGASFGTTGLSWTLRGNVSAYGHSKWIKGISATFIDFNVPSWPALNRWIGRRIPLADARWMGHLLAQLSPTQIRDAFRAAGYSSNDVEEFSRIVERRIGELEGLREAD